MSDIVVYLPPDMEPILRKKFAEMLRIRQITTTTNLQDATVVIVLPNQTSDSIPSLEESAKTIMKRTGQDIFILKEQSDISSTAKFEQYIRNKMINRIRRTQQKLKKIFLPRTKHK